MSNPSPSPLDIEVRRIVAEVLGGYPDGSAEIRHEWHEPSGMWWTLVRPVRPSAAKIEIGSDGDDLLNVVVGDTWFEFFPIHGPRDLGEIADIVAAVAAGKIEESGRWSKFARIATPIGARSVGSAHMPSPWAWRRVRRYEAYGPSDTSD